MSDESQDKQHAATGKKLAELSKQGTVLRSKDLSGAMIFILSIIFIIKLASQFKIVMENNFFTAFTAIKSVLRDPDYFNVLLKNTLVVNFKLLLPIFLIGFVITFLSPFLFGGWNFTLEVLQFKFNKLNPTENIKRLFSLKHNLTEIARSMVKSFFILGVLVIYLIVHKNQLLSLTTQSGKAFISSTCSMIEGYILILCASLIATVLFDMIYNYYQFQNKSKMTNQEVKDESKDTDGNVHTKRKIRSTQLALMKQRLSLTVPKASVIITNPTHYAVALRYAEGKDRAPRLLAKGQGSIAAQIRQLAISNAIPIYEAPALARSIYFTTKLNAEIHPGLYMAVAIVLSYVYQLKNYQMGFTTQLPNYIDDLQIPEELRYDHD